MAGQVSLDSRPTQMDLGLSRSRPTNAAFKMLCHFNLHMLGWAIGLRLQVYISPGPAHLAIRLDNQVQPYLKAGTTAEIHPNLLCSRAGLGWAEVSFFGSLPIVETDGGFHEILQFWMVFFISPIRGGAHLINGVDERVIIFDVLYPHQHAFDATIQAFIVRTCYARVLIFISYNLTKISAVL